MCGSRFHPAAELRVDTPFVLQCEWQVDIQVNLISKTVVGMGLVQCVLAAAVAVAGMRAAVQGLGPFGVLCGMACLHHRLCPNGCQVLFPFHVQMGDTPEVPQPDEA